MTPYKAARGITWIEFSVAVLLISVFAAMLLTTMWRTHQAAEKSAFEWTVRNLKIGLRLKVTHLLATNRPAEMNALVGSNPALLLDERPLKEYMGETDGASDVREGVWYFDRSRKELVYRFHQRFGWLSTTPEPMEGRLSIQTRNEIVRKSGSELPVEGIELVVQLKR